MPYIKRNNNGEITALYKESPDPEAEHLSPSHPEIVAFLENNGDSHDSISALSESDKDIARVTEDLIHLLISKNLILFTELPVPVQRKLLAREKLRDSLQGSLDDFLDANDTL